MTKHYRYCYFCQATCGVEITVDDKGVVTSVQGDPENSLSEGFICPKATMLKDIHEDPDRLRKPMRKAARGWEEMSWDDAYDEVARRISDIQQKYGPDSVAIYYGMGAMQSASFITHLRYLRRHLEGAPFFSPNSIDMLPLHLACNYAYGGSSPIPDLENIRHLVMIGSNLLVSNSSVFSAPNMRRRMNAILDRGGKVVVIDPRRTETGKAASEHHFIRPGADSALLLAMFNTLIEDGIEVPDYVDGLRELSIAARAFTPERVAKITGIEADTIRKITREFRDEPMAAIYGRIGTCIQSFGTLANWLIQILNAMTGKLNRQGGLLFPTPVFGAALGEALSFWGQVGKYHTRVRNLPSYGDDLPVSAMAEEMLTPGAGQIRALIVLGGNPVLTTPNGRKLEKALEQLEFCASFDIFINETSRFADIVIPNASALEQDGFPILSRGRPVRRHLQYAPAVFPTPHDSRRDWEVMVGMDRAFSRVREIEPLPIQTLDEALDYYFAHGGEITVNLLRQHPHGLDLGSIEPNPVPVKDLLRNAGKVDCACAPMIAEIERAEGELFVEPPEDTLQLIARRDLRSLGSWFHNSSKLMKGRRRDHLEMHSADMARYGLSDGDNVRLMSAAGSAEIPVQATDDMMPGVVSLPYGWGHGRKGSRLSIADQAANRGVSINDLTDDTLIDAASGTAAVTGVRVKVAAASD